MLKILIKLKNRELKTIETDKALLTIGRNENNDIYINNLGISKKHAKIVRQGDTYILEDLGSTNGTFLNDKRVKKSPLASHDTITIGKYTFLLLIDEQRSATRDMVESTIKI
jgi:pSer/pThr/pTyr-binding forkhead associated (FHA) protein